MKTTQKPVRGIDWNAIFQRRPGLEPPGYRETVAKIKASKRTPNGTV